MNKKEVKKVIKFKGSGEVPLKTEDISPETFKKYGDKLWELLKKYPNDFIALAYDTPTGWKSSVEGEDEWGCVWSHVEGQTGALVKKHPLDTWDKFLNYKFPDPLAPGRFDSIKNCLRVPTDIYTVGHGLHGFFIKGTFLRGFEQFSEDLFLEKEKVKILFDKYLEFISGIVNGYKKWADCVVIGDDIGSTKGLIINPDTWRELIKPYYKKMFDYTHKCGMDVGFHSCGDITEIMSDLIDIGVDIFNNIQPSCMDLEKIGREYKGKVCFMVGAEKIIRTGTPVEVYKYMVWLINTFGTKDGGFITCSGGTILPDVPLENIEAMYKATKEYSVLD